MLLQRCNEKKTVVIENVEAYSLIKHSSVIKSEFNKLFKRMKINSCFATAKGSVFVELTTEDDAKQVVRDWKSSNFKVLNSAKDTMATLLLDKGAQGIIKDVDVE